MKPAAKQETDEYLQYDNGYKQTNKYPTRGLINGETLKGFFQIWNEKRMSPFSLR